MQQKSSYRYRTVTLLMDLGLTAVAREGWRGQLPPGGGDLKRGESI